MSREGTQPVLIGKAFSSDGHVRLTRGERFLVAGGDEKDHRQMQDVAQRFQKATKNCRGELNGEQLANLLAAAGVPRLGSVVKVEIHRVPPPDPR